MMRAACAREDRAHTQKRSRVALTGRNTLKRQFEKEDAAALPKLGGGVDGTFMKKMCVAAAATGDERKALFRA